MRNKIVFRSAIITILASCTTIGENQEILKREVVGSYVVNTIEELKNEAKLLYPNAAIKVQLLGKYYTQSKYCKPLAELKFKKISIKDIDLNFA